MSEPTGTDDRSRGRGGRPSKGVREPVAARIPGQLARDLDRAWKPLNECPYRGDWIEQAIVLGLRHPQAIAGLLERPAAMSGPRKFVIARIPPTLATKLDIAWQSVGCPFRADWIEQAIQFGLDHQEDIVALLQRRQRSLLHPQLTFDHGEEDLGRTA